MGAIILGLLVASTASEVRPWNALGYIVGVDSGKFLGILVQHVHESVVFFCQFFKSLGYGSLLQKVQSYID